MSRLVARNAALEAELEREIAELEALERGEAPNTGEKVDAREEKPFVSKEEEPATEQAPDKEEELSVEERTWKKRHGDLRRHTQKQIDELKTEIGRLKEKPSVDALPPASVEEVKAWAEKNPKAAAIIRELASTGAREEVSSKEFTERLEKLEELKEENARREEEAKIAKVHPDLADLQNSDDFHDWAEAQVPTVKNMVYDGTSEEVIWAITQYKLARGIKTKEIEREAGKGVKRSSKTDVDVGQRGKTFSESQVSVMPLHEYERLQDDIEEAQRAGRFVYDMTGAAR